MSDLNLEYLKEHANLLEGAAAGYVNRGVITELGWNDWNQGRFWGYMTVEHVITCSDHGGDKWDEFKKLLNGELLGYLRSELLIRQEDRTFCLHNDQMSAPELVLNWMGGKAKIYLMRRGSYCWVLAGYWPEVKASFDDMLEAAELEKRKNIVDMLEKGRADVAVGSILSRGAINAY